MSHFQNPAAWHKAQQLIQEALDTNSNSLSLSGLRLKTLPPEFIQLAPQLNTLTLEDCRQLINVDLIQHCQQLTSLNLSGCHSLTELTGIAALTQLNTLNLNGCSNLTELTGIAALTQLNALNLHDCNNLSSLTDIAALTQLNTLYLSYCSNLSNLTGIAALTQLNTLSLHGCSNLSELTGIAALTQLNTLDLSYCRNLSDLTGIAALTQLNILDLSGFSHLTDLTGIAALTQLNTLYLNGCSNLTELTGIAALTQLNTLNLRSCSNLSELTGIAALTQLNTLDLRSCSNLSELTGIAALTQLNTLNLSYCSNLSELTGIDKLTQLNTLDLSGCSNLSELTGIDKLTQLNTLDLSGCCNLSDLAGIDTLTQLNTLHLSGCCNLSELTGIDKLTQLNTLDLRSCSNLSSLTDIAALTQLNTLNLRSCSNLSSLTDIAALTQLNTLNLSDCSNLSELTGIDKLTQLNTLNLSYCSNLSELTGIDTLTQLNTLNLSGCYNLTESTGIAALTQLNTLDLSGCNNLTELTGIAALTQLNTLNLSGCNNLTELTGIAALTQLNTLNLRSCSNLSELTGIAALTQLNTLDLRSCSNLSELTGIAALTQLNTLNLSGCRNLTELTKQTCLTECMKYAPYLNTFIADNFHIKGIPVELTKHIDRLDTIEDYLHDCQAGEINLKQTKLFVLGNGRIGKTQLVRRLANLPYDESITSTHGIQISQWSVNNENKHQNKDNDHTIFTWDFGGQDVYLGTHSMFLDDRAVYCLLWHPTFEHDTTYTENGIPMRDHKLSYWLSYLHSITGKEAPVIITQSQCDSALDDKPAPIPPAQPFKWLKPTQISAKNEDGLETFYPILKRALAYQQEKNGEVKLPISWWQVVKEINQLQTKQQKLLTPQAYLKLCNTEKVSAPTALLYYLHQAGQVFYKQGLFNNQIILDQAWALDGVYSLLERNSTLPLLTQKQGKFLPAELAEYIWKDKGYTPDEQNLFIEMMQQCGVCFKINEHCYIAPDCLPEQSHSTVKQLTTQIWQGTAHTIEVVLHYTFLHQANMRSILSHIGEKAGEHAAYWRYGCCWYDSKNKTKIYLDCSTQQPQTLTPDEIAYFGSPGTIKILLAGANAQQLAEHLVESILDSHQLGEKPSVAWEKGSPLTHQKEFNNNMQHTNSFTQLNEASLPNKADVYFSYGWGNENDTHQAVCDELYSALQPIANVYRDKEATKIGDSIDQFEQRIGKAKYAVVILSNKYLNSDHCMKELMAIYAVSQKNRENFRARIIPIVITDSATADNEENTETVRISEVLDRLKYVEPWKTKHDELDAIIKTLGSEAAGSEAVNSLQLYREILSNLNNVLTYISDIIMPRSRNDLNNAVKELLLSK